MAYNTQEKLKSYLDTNQLQRERLCLSLMQIDKRFENVRPRHPRGGPDGGIDILANYENRMIACGAVGFINQANDSSEQKKRIVSKFKEDVDSAWKAVPRPNFFVFFTNIDFTLGEKSSLIDYATDFGFQKADIYDRETIRCVLDSVNGFALRQQYLNIPMSEAEQASFFSQWGENINTMISERIYGIEEKLDRILFLQESKEVVSDIGIHFNLNRRYDSNEIKHFRLMTHIQLLQESAETQQICVITGDNAYRYRESNPPNPSIPESFGGGVGSRVWLGKYSNILEEKSIFDASINWKHLGTSSSRRERSYSTLYSRASMASDFIRYGDYITLQDLDKSMFSFLTNQSIAQKIESIEIYANGYLLDHSDDWKIEEYDFEANNVSNEVDLIESFVTLAYTKEELEDQWSILRPGNGGSTTWIRFSYKTPKKVYKNETIELPEKKEDAD